MLLQWRPVGCYRLFLTYRSTVCALSSVPLINANEFITKKRKSQKLQQNSKVTEPSNSSVPLISCKRKEFNHYRGHSYAKFEPIPLASTGWHHTKSKGDYFTINNLGAATSDSECMQFIEMGISTTVENALKRQGITKPTAIQEQGIPVLLSGNNALLAAETGCGKTLAYLLPLLHQILMWVSLAKNRQLNSPLGIIITPSRELAHQIMEVALELTQDMPIDCELLTGGRTKQKMLHPDFKPVDLLVATLGAVSKLTTTGIYNMKMVRHVVLDEADTLLDDSFIEKLVYFLKKFPFHLKGDEASNAFPNGAQLTLVSATMPTSLPEALGEVIVPESLEKVVTGSLHHFLSHVPQLFMRVRRSSKPAELLKLVKSNKTTPTIVFSNKTPTCDWLSMFLNENGVGCVNLNGEMPLLVRAGKFREFQSGQSNVLSCTDVGSRGLDTVRAKLVINYDFPLHTADYIHRCGRVGRMGSPDHCKVVSFIVGPREVDVVQKMELAARKTDTLPNVNANITKMILNRILRNSQKSLKPSSNESLN